jgi:hypothetical protein
MLSKVMIRVMCSCRTAMKPITNANAVMSLNFQWLIN